MCTDRSQGIQSYLLDLWHAIQFNIEHVEFLVAPSDLALFVNPQEIVLDSFAFRVVAGLVHADGNGQGVLPRIFLEAQNERRFAHGLTKGQ